MSSHRDLAVHVMQRMNQAIAGGSQPTILPPDIPEPIVVGSLPAMARETVPAQFLHMLVDIEMVWTIAEWDQTYDCSAYYDPSSPWYNVFYGAYGLRSYKGDGTAWGYNNDADGTPNFAEFLQVPRVDYNFLTAGMFGCPPEMMSFDARDIKGSKQNGWDVADFAATIPSALHDPINTVADPSTYVIYGVPDPSFIAGGHASYEPVAMRGRLYMKQAASSQPRPITYAWGALCPDTPAGQVLLTSIVATLGKKYFQL